TQRAPSTVPPTDASPPITPIDTRRSDSEPEKRSGVNVTRSPASSAPLTPASAPEMANAVSLARPGVMPNDAADGSFERTAMNERPTALRRNRDVIHTATTRNTRHTT